MIAGLVGLLLLAGAAEQGDTLSAVFWNLENFFDWRNDSTSVSDADFSSRGSRRWTRRRFETKCQGVAKTLLWSASVAGRLPDIVGVAEVENAFVLRRLLRDTPLRKLDYGYVHFDSPDRRGIDVALLYRKGALELVDAKPCHLYDDSLRVMPTRDILLCRFRLRGRGSGSPENRYGSPGGGGGIGTGFGGDHRDNNGKDAGARECAGGSGDFAVLVNHHPSKFGGAAESDARRRAAVGRLRFLADSLSGLGVARILAFGDFNDTPANPLYKTLEPRLMPLYGPVLGEGTIRFDGRWELIDLAFASPAPGSPVKPSPAPANTPAPAVPAPANTPVPANTPAPAWTGPMRILRPPFLRAPDRAHGGWKPLRTYTGPRYNGGLSDHCPIQVDLYL